MQNCTVLSAISLLFTKLEVSQLYYILNFSTERARVTLESTKSRAANKKNTKNGPGSKGGGGGRGGGGSSNNNKDDGWRKFENYFEFSVPVKYAKPHQVIN